MKKIFVAGHRGMVGSAIVRQLEQLGGCEIVTRTRDELNLLSQADVTHFFETENIDQVYLAVVSLSSYCSIHHVPKQLLFHSSCP